MSAAATSATDLSDLGLFAGGAPWEAFARLRRDAPARQMDIRRSMLETDGARHWALRRLLQRDPASSSS